MPKTAAPKLSSRNANKHELYELAVQDVETEAKYIERLYRRMRGKPARRLKEDFCGTASLCCQWVRNKKEHLAVGVDLHKPTLEWGKRHRLGALSDEQRTRVELIEGDVLDVTRPKVEIVVALNFSYFIFKSRELLKRYFKTVYRSLDKDGIFLLDAYGGSEAMEVLEESRKCKGFTYVWEHADFNPVTSETVCNIHFEFKDGSRMNRAFTYDWRLWTLAEIQELLSEVGFSEVEIHWEGTDRETGEGNGIFRKTKKGEAIESWVAYVVALK